MMSELLSPSALVFIPDEFLVNLFLYRCIIGFYRLVFIVNRYSIILAPVMFQLIPKMYV